MRYDGTGAQKVSSWTAFYRMRFHEGWSVVVDCASLRPTAWMFDGASRIAWKYRRVVPPPSFSLSLSLSLSLFSSLSLRPILPAITSLVDQIKGPGGATVGPGEWMKWLTGCRGLGMRRAVIRFPRGWLFLQGFQIRCSHVPWNPCEFNSRTRESTWIERAQSNSYRSPASCWKHCIFRRELKRFAARAALRYCLPWPSFRVIFFIRCALCMIEGKQYPASIATHDCAISSL